LLKACILAGPEFEDLELFYPLIRLREEGSDVDVVGPEKVTYIGKHSLAVKVERTVEEVSPEQFDVLIIPGGWAPDRLRRNRAVLEFVANFFKSGKLVAAICHGPQVLISAKVLRGYRATSSPAVADDLINAGAFYEDKPVVVDRNLITSRGPDDLHLFVKAIINQGGFR
jgi:protease I